MSNDKLKVGDSGIKVTNLQIALKKHGFKVSPEEEKRQFFGSSTREMVGEFQKTHGIDPSCEVCMATAARLEEFPIMTTTAASGITSASVVNVDSSSNSADALSGLMSVSSPVQSPSTATYSTKGKKSLKLINPPLRFNDQGAEVANLQEALLLLIQQQAVQLPESEKKFYSEGLQNELQNQIYASYTAKFLELFQSQFSTRFSLRANAEVDNLTANALNTLLKELGALSSGQNEDETYTVNGNVMSDTRAGIDGLRVVIVDKNIGSDVFLAETVTGNNGFYQSTFLVKGLHERCKQQPDLQSRIFKGEAFLSASDVRYNASKHETLNISLDEQASSTLASEYESLTSVLTGHCHGNLKDLKETEEQQDITYLANKTGWDARAVAMAALAEQFSAKTLNADNLDGIDPAFFYALFRAGLPANDDVLYQVDVNNAETIWKQAIAQGVIASSMESLLPQAYERFHKLAAQRALDTPALTGVSSLKEMLTVSLGDDLERQQQFTALYTQHRDEPNKLWEAVRNTLGELAEKRLRLDGQLSYLTLNNALLISKLHDTTGENGLTHTLDLVDQGFYLADKWKAVIGESPIPQEISGKDDAEKRANYAELMAAQIRLSFPTAVVAETIRNIEGANFSAASNFLREHRGKFELGMQPVEQYISRNNLQVAEDVIQNVKQVQRVSQITPSDSAMTGLLKRGIHSAYAVVSYDRDDFIRIFKDEVGGEENALLTYTKSQQVHNAVLNIAMSYLIAKNAPPVGVHSPAQTIDSSPKVPENVKDVIAYGTLEDLFHEMDYCACEHCRSILSPAAYLVDLLQFIDLKRHDEKVIELPKADEEKNPLHVLLDRRPDIQHLPLTCENTNLPLPYIDLVNETLEYFIFNKLSLEKYEGHSTDDSATAEELLANPQFGDTQASTEAYKILATARFPLPLPFHQPLESLRRYFERFETPLSEVMEALRENDNLDRPITADPANPIEYGWRDILMEELRISRAEYSLLSDHTLSLQQIYGYPEATSETDVLASLSNAKAFTRRVGISYEDIIKILHTRFVNPNSTLIPKLERLYLPFATIKSFKEGTITDIELPKGLDAAQYGGDIKAWIRNEENYANIMGIITLANPVGKEDQCSFDKLEFRYSDPDKINEPIRLFEFFRILRFIRLWKKLDWTIEQTDKAIAALYPIDQIPNDKDDTANLQRLDAGFLTLLPRLGVIKRVMKALNLKLKKDLLPLLACFAPIDTHGTVSLYRQMFLSPALLKQDPILADNGYGRYLADETQKLLKHTETLRAAFQLTSEELSLITEELGYDANTSFTIDNISPIFRRGWLARKLKLSVREFLLITRFARLDPFAAPDAPNPPILNLINMLDRLSTISVKTSRLLYLLWNQDISGKSAPGDGEVLGLGRILRGGFAEIENEFVVKDDPDGQVARARMALLYDNDATDQFFGLLEEKTVTNVQYEHDKATLDQLILDTGLNRIAYDSLRKRLSYTGGILPDTMRDALKDISGVTQKFKDAIDELHKKSRLLFDRFPELLPLYNNYAASNESLEKKRSNLLDALLSTLKPQRKRQQALQAISAATKVDINLANNLLDSRLEGKYILHSVSSIDQPAVNNLTALETQGLSAQFFFRDTATGTVDFASDVEVNLDYSITAKNKAKIPANGGNSISGIWNGYLEMPENSFYNFYIETDMESVVSLVLDGKTIELIQTGNVRSNKSVIELRAGTLYSIALKVEKVRNSLAVRWENEVRGKEIIPARFLYSEILIARFRATYIRLLKAISLAETLNLTTGEIVHFASADDYQIADQGWLNSLPVIGSPDAATSTALLKVLMALLDFARIKANLSPDDDRLLTVLKDPEVLIKNLTADSSKPKSLLITLTHWEPNSLDVLLTRFGKMKEGIADHSALKDLETFSRIETAYGVLKKLGISAAALIKATTNEPNAGTIRDLQSALRARYEQSDWLNVLKPINDEMRVLQRDALVAYILHQMRTNPKSAHIDTPEKLFEYFLMDVQMSPCMQTSRIRHALSSVQLFIERCLMNLEKNKVDPSSIDLKQWEWMKRYRVWEANRKIFLYPENWLEPELRDDQSPIFKQAMSELLQSDITEDSAAAVLLNYLSGLNEVAKLEPCGIHYVENDLSKPEDDIAHVVARTVGANRKYFYRRRDGVSWTPWEQIQLDIEDNPVIPVVWKGRLFVFWLRIIKKMLTPEVAGNAQNKNNSEMTGETKETGNGATGFIVSKALIEIGMQSLKSENFANMTLSRAKAVTKDSAQEDIKLTVQAVLCWSEFFNGKWQPTKTSDINRPVTLGSFDSIGRNEFDRSKLRLHVREDKGNLRIFIDGEGTSEFILYNTHSLPLGKGERGYSNPSPNDAIPQSIKDTSSDTFRITYTYKTPTSFVRSLLQSRSQTPAQTIEPNHSLQNSPEAPFFYEDRDHVFYVTTKEEEWVPISHREKYPLPAPQPSRRPYVIPSLRFESPKILPDLIAPVSADYLKSKVIASTTIVRFHDAEIGVMGSQS